jgi:transcriptional regulator with XRE-family HTH domain
MQTIPPEMKKLALSLRNLRTENGFSLREAARNANISPSYLSKIEAGDTFTTIGIKTILSLAKAYNTPLVVILQESGLLEDESKLPEMPQYLRLKYSLSQQAIRDMEMAKQIVDKKYKTLSHITETSPAKE